MNLKVNLAFGFMMVSFVISDGSDVSPKLQSCIEAVDYLMRKIPDQKCYYMGDAVRCAIGKTNLLTDNSQRENVWHWASTELQVRGCSTKFELILRSAQGTPQLMVLQGCFDAAADDYRQNPSDSRRCQVTEDAVRCTIDKMGLTKADASQVALGYSREMSDRYLKPNNCGMTFDDILDRMTNSGPAVFPTGWLTVFMVAVMVALSYVF